MSCRPELLEAHLRGELHGAEAEAAADHLRACPACQRETSWLKAEHRLFAERARELTPPYVQLARIRGKVDQAVRQRMKEQRRARAARSGGAVLSAVSAVLIAFVIATVPSNRGETQLGWLEPESCSSMERGGFAHAVAALCVPASGGHEVLAAVENQFDACLVATPDALPGIGVCH